MRISVISIFLVVALAIACSHRSNDEQIAKDIQNKIATDPDTKDSQITVAAKEGKVTLTGQATTAAAQQKVEQFSHQEPGATAVDDQTTIAVAPAPMAAAPPAAMAAPPTPPVARNAAPTPVPAAKTAPAPQPIVIPAGTVITIRTSQALSSKTSQAGQNFVGSLDKPVSIGGKTAIPKGADVSGTVVAAKEQGKIKGEGELDLALTSVVAGGHTYQVKTEVVSNTVKGKGKRTAATTGGGAAGGALIGGIAGGGKGAAIGALAGGGAGLVGGAMTGNKPIEIPAESVLTFTLSAPLTLPPSGGTSGNEQKHP